MTLVKSRSDREYQKFIETDGGDAAVRTKLVDFSGDVNLSLDLSQVTTNGMIGKPSGTNGDFVTAYASGTTLTCATLPTGVSAINESDIVSITQITNAGAVTKTFFRGDSTISCSGTDPTTITVTGATFLATDVFVVYTNIEKISKAPSTIGVIVNSAVGTTAEQITSTSTVCKKVIVTANPDNTGTITIGPSGVTAGNGIVLVASDNIELSIDDVNKLYVVASVDGEDVSATYFN